MRKTRSLAGLQEGSKQGFKVAAGLFKRDLHPLPLNFANHLTELQSFNGSPDFALFFAPLLKAVKRLTAFRDCGAVGGTFSPCNASGKSKCKTANNAVIQGFSGILKTTKQYNSLYHLMVVNMVELGGIEPPSESTLTQTSPGADGYFGISPVFPTVTQAVTRSR